MTIEAYIPRAPSDPYVAGVVLYPSLVREGVPYQSGSSEFLFGIPDVSSRGLWGVSMGDGHGQSSHIGFGLERVRRDGPVCRRATRRVGSGAEVARSATTEIRGASGMGITPVTGAGSSGLGQTSSSPPPDPVSREWFFDDPSPP
uniref:Uncharacterized protein n=1 Tax=Fagus sylvatica TaxID=28930 RepID=A0A2N9HP32_FAGSY